MNGQPPPSLGSCEQFSHTRRGGGGGVEEAQTLVAFIGNPYIMYSQGSRAALISVGGKECAVFCLCD